MMSRGLKIIHLLLVCLLVKSVQAEIVLNPVFGDNMVLQQDAAAPVWGKGNPGSTITVTADWGVESSTICRSDSSWMTTLQTPSAGGPYSVLIRDEESQRKLNNVLIGEVWLCSGQSNMEMPLKGWLPKDTIMYSATEISRAQYPKIRFFTVAKKIAISPERKCDGAWLECSPKTAANFSATAYFFGKKLHQELNIPVGLIHTSWGGTPAEAWTGKEYLSKIEDFQETLKMIDAGKPALEALENWLSRFPQISVKSRTGKNVWAGLEFQDSECKMIDFDDAGWARMNLPTLWEATDFGAFDGVIWFRKKVEIPDNWLGKELRVRLGPIDDFDRTYVNGELVGAIEEEGQYQTFRSYDIPAELNHQSVITLAVRVNDIQGGGGIYGKREDLQLVLKETGAAVSIAGEWKYLPVAEYRGSVYTVFGAAGQKYRERPHLPIELTYKTPTVLYNGMIAPLIPFAIQGAIWYQGESNTGDPLQYETLFPTMIANWRADWGYEFPFYYVQIAPYDYGNGTHSELLRDVQRKSLMIPNTGMAVTLDIGTVNNIHPPNKQAVGERLARWALAQRYGKDIVPSGPLYKDHRVKGKKVIIRFDYADGLHLKPGVPAEFLIAGKDKVFYPADVKIRSDRLIVSSKKVKAPVAVRYSWSNTSGASLFNAAGLPASTFRTDQWVIEK
ncbi:MAG: sialate O-acetylesterase [Fidelibacterota bacterium]